MCWQQRTGHVLKQEGLIGSSCQVNGFSWRGGASVEKFPQDELAQFMKGCDRCRRKGRKRPVWETGKAAYVITMDLLIGNG